jgi:carboxyl-terminal processing protease
LLKNRIRSVMPLIVMAGWLLSSSSGFAAAERTAHSGRIIQAYAEATWDDGAAGPAEESAGTDARREKTGLELWDKALALIKAHYVKDVSDKEIYQESLQRLRFALLPQCTENVPRPGECTEGTAECFARALKSIAERCGIPLAGIESMALRLLLRDLDLNSGLLDGRLLEELKISTSGRFGGVGMVVAPKDGDYVVVSPIEGSPAQHRGIRAGDTILEIDGKPLHGLPLVEVLGLVRGPAGSYMVATLRTASSGEVRDVRLRRKIIRIPPVRFRKLQSGIGYLRIVNFQRDTRDQVRKAMRAISGRGRGRLKGLVLDLRDNPGGLFNEAIKVADLFLSSTTITSVKGRDPQFSRKFTAAPNGELAGLPTIVLINQGSASAAEILAGALQGQPNVLLMGRKTFGKASVQAIFPLTAHRALRLTSAHYFTADGQNIDGKGIEPDIPVREAISSRGPSLAPSEAGKPEEDEEIKEAWESLVSGRPPRRSPFVGWF